MNENMILIMVDETGDEVEVGRYYIPEGFDDDMIEVWEERKIDRANDEFPEARGFYFEDRRNWNRKIYMDIAQWF